MFNKIKDNFFEYLTADIYKTHDEQFMQDKIYHLEKALRIEKNRTKMYKGIVKNGENIIAGKDERIKGLDKTLASLKSHTNSVEERVEHLREYVADTESKLAKQREISNRALAAALGSTALLFFMVIYTAISISNSL